MDATRNIGSDGCLSGSLSRIADLLEFPIEAFFDESRQSELGTPVQILELWCRIKDEDGRRAVLDVVRAIVAAQDNGIRR